MIWPNQMGFVSEMSEWLNKSINAMHHTGKMKDKYHMIIAGIVEKMFHKNTIIFHEKP